jgi:hypothetical protein
MEIILRHGCPLALHSFVAGCIFIALPGLLAALGARLLQGSFLRIVGGAVGGGLRDGLVLVAVSAGWITVTNSQWEFLVSYILVFFGACGGALGSCLAPYRGKLLVLNSAVGGLLGQFCLPFVLFSRKSRH